MSLTVEQIVEEARTWPVERVEELVIRLNLALDPTPDPQIDAEWKKEVRRRLDEVENGTIELVDGEEVSAKIRKMLNR